LGIFFMPDINFRESKGLSMTTVLLADGERGTLEQDSQLGERGKAVLLLESGRRVIVPENVLISEEDGYRLPFAAGELETLTKGDDTLVVPVIEETLRVTKQEVVTGGVRLTKRVTEREEVVDEALLRQDVHVERVAINRMVAEAPQARQEGDTFIVPLLEEVLVVEKRLFLKEEVRITRTQTEVHQPQTVTIRMEEAVLEEITPTTPLT
jgi:uncharacterized protein (TIGR02271 family)